jgi:hypothetical protein
MNSIQKLNKIIIVNRKEYQFNNEQQKQEHEHKASHMDMVIQANYTKSIKVVKDN